MHTETKTELHHNTLKTSHMLAWKVMNGKREYHKSEVNRLLAMRPRQRHETQH